MFACCDESGIQKKSRWFLGAMWLPDDDLLPRYEADATALRQRMHCWGEFKWNKVGPSRLDDYQEFLSLTLALPDLRFTSMVVDTKLHTREEMKKFHGGQEDLAYLKHMRDLIRYRIMRWVDQGHLDFTLLYDKQAVRGRLAADFKEIVSGDMPKLAATRKVASRFVHVSAVNSASVHLMQAADLLTGATWHAWEQDRGAEKKEAAREALTAQIEAWAGGKLTHTRFPSDRYYSLWPWKPRESTSQARRPARV